MAHKFIKSTSKDFYCVFTQQKQNPEPCESSSIISFNFAFDRFFYLLGKSQAYLFKGVD